MTIAVQLMLLFLIVCAVAACVTRDLLASVVIYMGYSMIMSVVWITLQSPDLAITEAAVGAGITSLLLFLTLKRIHAIDAINEERGRTATAKTPAKDAAREAVGALSQAQGASEKGDGPADGAGGDRHA